MRRTPFLSIPPPQSQSSFLSTKHPSLVNACLTISSPIAIPSANSHSHTKVQIQSANSANMTPRSLPRNANGLYVPVHRRGGSTSSVSSSSSSSFLERGSLSPIARPTKPRMRSVSPMPRTPRSPRAFGTRHLDASPTPSPRATNIPPVPKIPNTYTISELLALSSALARLSPLQYTQLDAHIPLMTRKPRSSAPSSSASSSPSSTIAPLPAPTPTPAPAPAPAHTTKPSIVGPDAQKMRSRRPGRKNSGGKPRVAPTLGADVEARRRRTNANWGWAAHGGDAPEQDSWRSHAVAVAA